MLLIGLTLALLCFSSAAAGALLSVPPELVFSPVNYRGASFEPALGEFLADQDIPIGAGWSSSPVDPFEILTTATPEQVRRIEKDTSGMDSGKSVFQTPEPPEIVMFLIGAGLIFVARLCRQVHRRGRRRVRVSDRQMAHI